jgi:sarcosine oxidase delta subunit
MSALICPFCNKELEEELYNSLYGCDTGCEFVRIEIECPHCKKVTWDSGTFGHYGDDEYDYKTKDEYREEFMTEFAQWVEKNKPERLKGQA